jgi:hypothetical protein
LAPIFYPAAESKPGEVGSTEPALGGDGSNPFDESDIAFAVSTDYGATFGDPMPLNTDDDGDNFMDTLPSIACDRNGNWVVAWRRNDSIFTARPTDNGANWTAPATLFLATGARFVQVLRMAADTNGHLVVAFERINGLFSPSAVESPGLTGLPTEPYIAIAGPDADSFVVVGDTGETMLDEGATRTLTLAFAPTTPGRKRAWLEVLPQRVSPSPGPGLTGNLQPLDGRDLVIVPLTDLSLADPNNRAALDWTLYR